MSNQEQYNSTRRFLAVNAVAGAAASELAKINREEAVRLAKIRLFNSHYLSEAELADRVGRYLLTGDNDNAATFLAESLRKEIVHDCQNQKEFKAHLSELIVQRCEKYRPFFDKIGREMPAELAQLKAEEICTVMSVELMTPEQLKRYHEDKEAEEWAENLMEGVGLAFRIILIIGLLILMFCLSA